MKTQDAINHFGSKTKLCEALGLSRMNASHWGYWVPKKHAMTLGHETDLKYDHALYSGESIVNIDDVEFKAAPWVSSIQILNRELEKGSDLFFDDGDGFNEDMEMSLISNDYLTKEELASSFKLLPIYQKVTTCS